MEFTHLHTARGRFAIRRHGTTGEIVVCVHGFPDDASTFDGLADALVAAGYRVVAVNLRGYSPSPLDGSMAMGDLVEDLAGVVEALSPDAPVCLIGHDYGAQISYPAMAHYPERFRRAVLLAGAHPHFIQRNARRSLRQVWMSRYIVFFQFGGYADRRVARNSFASIDKLWRRWSPGFTMQEEHRAHVKNTLHASMPQPVAMYRAGSFTVAPENIPVPTLYITGADDGCALPFLADGQSALFTTGYAVETWENTGHFPHLEQPDRTANAVLRWLGTRTPEGM